MIFDDSSTFDQDILKKIECMRELVYEREHMQRVRFSSSRDSECVASLEWNQVPDDSKYREAVVSFCERFLDLVKEFQCARSLESQTSFIERKSHDLASEFKKSYKGTRAVEDCLGSSPFYYQEELYEIFMLYYRL